MTNIGRPRTGLPVCPKCGSTERDSNGQCHCRNVLYRLKFRTKSKAEADRVVKTYEAELLDTTGNVEAAKAAVVALRGEKKKNKPAKKAAEEPAKKKAAEKPAKKKAAEAAEEPAKKKAAEEPAKKKAAEKPAKKKAAVKTVAEQEAEFAAAEAEALAARQLAADEEFEKAKPVVIEPVVTVDHQPVNAGHECSCGFTGKGTTHSIRAHVAREKRLAREGGEQA